MATRERRQAESLQPDQTAGEEQRDYSLRTQRRQESRQAGSVSGDAALLRLGEFHRPSENRDSVQCFQVVYPRSSNTMRLFLQLEGEKEGASAHTAPQPRHAFRSAFEGSTISS